MLQKSTKVSPFSIVLACLPPLSLTLGFFALTPKAISLDQLVMAVVLLLIPWLSYSSWKRNRRTRLPLFALIAFIYWVYYAVSLFWGIRTVSGIETIFEQDVSDDSISWSLLLAVAGVSSAWLGIQTRLADRFVPRNLPQLKISNTSVHYIRFLLVFGSFLGLFESLPAAFGEGARQVITIVISLVPLLAFALLFHGFVKGEATGIDKLLVLGFLAVRLITGLASGWLGSFPAIILICSAVYLAEKGKIPRLALSVVVLFTLFFQVGKQEFRRVHWNTPSPTSKLERVRFWTETSLNKWGDALTDPTGAAFTEALNSSLSRVSLLTQTANVIDLTPSAIPYQQWRLYSYMAVTWVPRAIWPGKPSMNEANQFYQVAYGLSTEEGTESVAIGVGVMTEAYISFGWIGVITIMFGMGVFYGVYQKLFFTSESGLLFTSLGIVLLPQMISIESQMAAYLGGLVQQVGLTLLIFLPVTQWRRNQETQRLVLPTREAGYQQVPDNTLTNV